MKPSERPVIDIPHTSLEVGLEVVALGVLFGMVATVALFWSSLPPLVPSHFDIFGTVDAWSDKRTILILPVVGLGLYAMLTITNHYPHKFNYAWPITLQNAERQYQLAHSLMIWLKMEVMLLFAYLEWTTIGMALGQTNSLGLFFLPLALVALFGTLGVYFYQAFQAR